MARPEFQDYSEHPDQVSAFSGGPDGSPPKIDSVIPSSPTRDTGQIPDVLYRAVAPREVSRVVATDDAVQRSDAHIEVPQPTAERTFDPASELVDAAIEEDMLRDQVNSAFGAAEVVDMRPDNTNDDQTLGDMAAVAESFRGKPETTLVHVSTASVIGDGHEGYMNFLLSPDWTPDAVHIDATPEPSSVRVGGSEEYRLLLDLAGQKVAGKGNALRPESREELSDIHEHEMQHGAWAVDEGMDVSYGVTFQVVSDTGENIFLPATIVSGTTTIAGYRRMQSAPDQPSQGDLTALGQSDGIDTADPSSPVTRYSGRK